MSEQTAATSPALARSLAATMGSLETVTLALVSNADTETLHDALETFTEVVRQFDAIVRNTPEAVRLATFAARVERDREEYVERTRPEQAPDMDNPVVTAHNAQVARDAHTGRPGL